MYRSISTKWKWVEMSVASSALMHFKFTFLNYLQKVEHPPFVAAARPVTVYKLMREHRVCTGVCIEGA